MKWNLMIEHAIQLGATDIHIQQGSIYWRLGMDVRATDYTVTEEDIDEFICERTEEPIDTMMSYDGAMTFEGYRIRVHLFRWRCGWGGTLRILYPPTAGLDTSEEGNLLRKITSFKEGLVIIAGATGSGKSYTLTSCLMHINETMHRHIITLEDPIEYVLEHKQSLIHQRELHSHFHHMADGIRDALREDPDVILIGEVRDKETLEAALHAAETGHLVFATLHTQRATMSINRMISMFPAHQQEEVRTQLSQILRAVICQRLVIIEERFIPIRDILINTPAVANLIRQRKEPQIVSLQETQRPMKTLEMAVAELRNTYGSLPMLDAVLQVNG